MRAPGRRKLAYTYLFGIKSNSKNEIDSFALSRRVCAVCVLVCVVTNAPKKKKLEKFRKLRIPFPRRVGAKNVFARFATCLQRFSWIFGIASGTMLNLI